LERLRVHGVELLAPIRESFFTRDHWDTVVPRSGPTTTTTTTIFYI